MAPWCSPVGGSRAASGVFGSGASTIRRPRGGGQARCGLTTSPTPSPLHPVCGLMLPRRARIRRYCVRSDRFTTRIGRWLGGSGPVRLAGRRGAGRVTWAPAVCRPLLVYSVRELCCLFARPSACSGGCRWGWLVPWFRRWRPWWRRAPYERGRCGWVLSLLYLATSAEDVVFFWTGVPHGFADGGHGSGILFDAR